MKSPLLIVAIASVWSALASAQEAAPVAEPPAVTGDALRLTIRPSSIEQTPAERLARRAEQLDFAFRFICRGCSGAPDPAKAASAPFNPGEVLARRPRAVAGDR